MVDTTGDDMLEAMEPKNGKIYNEYNYICVCGGGECMMKLPLYLITSNKILKIIYIYIYIYIYGVLHYFGLLLIPILKTYNLNNLMLETQLSVDLE